MSLAESLDPKLNLNPSSSLSRFRKLKRNLMLPGLKIVLKCMLKAKWILGKQLSVRNSKATDTKCPPTETSPPRGPSDPYPHQYISLRWSSSYRRLKQKKHSFGRVDTGIPHAYLKKT